MEKNFKNKKKGLDSEARSLIMYKERGENLIPHDKFNTSINKLYKDFIHLLIPLDFSSLYKLLINFKYLFY